MKYFLTTIFIFCSFFFAISCRTNKEPNSFVSTKPTLVGLLDSIEGAKAIVIDVEDSLFEKITPLDMRVQMKNYEPFSNRDKLLTEYKHFLQSEVSPWTVDEKQFMFDVFTEAKEMCDLINPRIYPGGIQLIKTKTNHYGKTVYYTRGKNIIIPSDILVKQNKSQEVGVMLHEIFHVLSRFDPDFRNDMYALIGFNMLNKPVVLSDVLSQRILANPDGMTTNYGLNISQSATDSLIVPLTVSRYAEARPSLTSFFDYLNFDLYYLKDEGTHYQAMSTSNAQSTLMPTQNKVYFEKIKDNTQYIIHPDEIMADNFMLAIKANKSGNYAAFSAEGRVLIDKVIQRLKEM